MVLQAGTDQIALPFQRNQRSVRWKTKTFMTLNMTPEWGRTLSEKPKSVKITIESYGDVLAVEKTFSTGSRGYYGSGKIEIAGKRYQIGVNIVEISSKPDTKVASKVS